MSKERLRTYIADRIAQDDYTCAPMIQMHRDYTPQYINRVLTQMTMDRKIRCVGRIGTTNYYVFLKSPKTLADIEKLVATRELMPTAWMGSERSPQECLTLLDKKRQSTARSLFDLDDARYIDYFNHVIPAVETMAYGKRASTQSEIDEARALISNYHERLSIITQFLSRFLENEHIRTGAFADALSDYAINRYRDGYRRDEAS